METTPKLGRAACMVGNGLWGSQWRLEHPMLVACCISPQGEANHIK